MATTLERLREAEKDKSIIFTIPSSLGGNFGALDRKITIGSVENIVDYTYVGGGNGSCTLLFALDSLVEFEPEFWYLTVYQENVLGRSTGKLYIGGFYNTEQDAKDMMGSGGWIQKIELKGPNE